MLKGRIRQRISALLLATAMVFAPAKPYAVSLDVQQIQLIKETSAAICNSVNQARGEKTRIEVKGDVQAKLQGLLGKLADVGISGNGSLNREAFEGLTQDATAIALEGDRQCRERLFNKMFDKLSFNSALDVYVVNFQGDGFWINNLEFGNVKAGSSYIEFSVDGDLIETFYLDGSFNGFTHSLNRGAHVITYAVDIKSSESPARIKQSCSAKFVIDEITTIILGISLKKHDFYRGSISACSARRI